MSDKTQVHNPTSSPVWVPGGLVEPGATVDRPPSEQLDELLGSGTLAEGQAPDDVRPWGDRSAEDVQAEFEERELQAVGTGAGGNLTKADRVAALERDDQERSTA